MRISHGETRYHTRVQTRILPPPASPPVSAGTAVRLDAPKRKPRPSVRWPFLVLLAAAVAGVWWGQRNAWIFTTGRVVTHQVDVRSLLRGRIVSIDVREGDIVKEGQVVARLWDAEVDAEIDRAVATLDEARARLAAIEESGLDPAVPARLAAMETDLTVAEEGIKSAEAELREAQLAVELARRIAERREKLYLVRALPRDDWETAVQDLRRAEAATTTAEARRASAAALARGKEDQLRRAQEALAYATKRHEKDTEALRMSVRRAEADLAAAKSRSAQTVLSAPRSGAVCCVAREVGEVVDWDDTIVTIADPDTRWIEAYVRAEDLADLRDGGEAWLEMNGAAPVRGRIALFRPTDELRAAAAGVGPDRARTPSEVSTLIHAVKVHFDGGPPAGLRPETIAAVKLSRR